jgi:citrate synthase
MSTGSPDGLCFTSAISELDDREVYVRGYRLGDLIRERTFVENTYLTLRGELPSPAEAAVFDAVLSALMSYTAVAGPNILAGRVAVSVNPQPWVGIATALSCAGPHTISPEHAAAVLADALARAATRPVAEVAAEVAAEHFDAGRALPGVGHPEFKDVDPRAAAILDVAGAHGMRGPASAMHVEIIDAYNRLRAPKRALPLNVDGAMARALTELGFRPIQMHAVSLISFLPGIAAHIVEEIEEGRRLRMLGPERETYTGPPRRSVPPRPSDD